MGKPDKIFRLEDKQDELLAKGDQRSMKQYWKKQRKQERLARKDPAAREVLDDIDQHEKIMDELAGLEWSIRLDDESATRNLQLETLRTRINDISKQLHRLHKQKDWSYREAQLKAAEAKLRYLESEYLDINKKYDRKLKNWRFMEDMRSAEQIQNMIAQIEQAINNAKQLWWEALTNATIGLKTKAWEMVENGNTTPLNSPERPNTAINRYRDKIITSGNITQQGKHEALRAWNFLNNVMQLWSYVAMWYWLFQLLFQKKKDGRNAHQWRSTLALGAWLRWWHRLLNNRDRSKKTQAEKAAKLDHNNVPETMEAKNKINQEKIMQSLGYMKIGSLGNFLNYSSNKSLAEIKWDELLTSIKNTPDEEMRWEKGRIINDIEHLKRNEWLATFQLIVEKRWLTRDYIQANPEQTLSTLYFSLEEENQRLSVWATDKKPEEKNKNRPTIQKESKTIEAKDDIYWFTTKLNSLSAVDTTSKNEAMKILVTLARRYPGATIDIKAISPEEILLTTNRGATQKINLKFLTLEGFDNKEQNLGVISFSSVEELMMTWRQSIVLLQLAKKLLQNKPEIKRPFETWWKIRWSKIDITTNEKNILEQLRSNITWPFDRTNVAAWWVGGIIAALAKKSVARGVKWGLVSTIWRELWQAVYDTRDTTALNRDEIKTYPTINEHLESYTEYLNNLYDHTINYNTIIPTTESLTVETENSLKNIMALLTASTTEVEQDHTAQITKILDSNKEVRQMIQQEVWAYSIQNNILTIYEKNWKVGITIELEKLYKEHVINNKETIMSARKNQGKNQEECEKLRDELQKKHTELIQWSLRSLFEILNIPEQTN